MINRKDLMNDAICLIRKKLCKVLNCTNELQGLISIHEKREDT